MNFSQYDQNDIKLFTTRSIVNYKGLIKNSSIKINPKIRDLIISFFELLNENISDNIYANNMILTIDKIFCSIKWW
jgi:hypothetical protein